MPKNPFADEAAGRQGPAPDVPRGLRAARADGAARRRRRVGGRQAHRLDRARRTPSAAIPRLARAVGAPAEQRAGDRARFRRRVRRQAPGRRRRRGGAAGEGRRQARPRPVDAARRSSPGPISARRRSSTSRRASTRRAGSRPGTSSTSTPAGPAIETPYRAGKAKCRVRRVRIAPAPRVVPVAGGHGQQLRARVLHGRVGRRGGPRPAGVPPGPPGQRPHARPCWRRPRSGSTGPRT